MDSRWTFEIEETFPIAGRGLAVLGQHHGDVIPAVGPAVLCVRGVSDVIEKVTVEMLDRTRNGRREGRVALLLHQVSMDRVPTGATIRSVD